MVNNILSIINLILVITALVIGIIALTNHNKDRYQENLKDNIQCYENPNDSSPNYIKQGDPVIIGFSNNPSQNEWHLINNGEKANNKVKR